MGFTYPSMEDWADATIDMARSETLRAHYETVLPDYAPRYNIPPTLSLPTIVYSKRDDDLKIIPMRWGWERQWTSKGKLVTRLIHNANFGTIMNGGKLDIWSDAFENRRCLIPASYVLDWQKRDDGSKVPWQITRADGKMMWLAGLWELASPIPKKPKKKTEESESLFEEASQEQAEPEKILYVSVATQLGNKLMQNINNAEPEGTQPILIDYELALKWLDPGLNTKPEVRKLIRTYKDEEIAVTPLAQIGDDKTHTAPIPRDWIDPYDVSTPYTPLVHGGF